MVWENLLKNKCPLCDRELWFEKSQEMLFCKPDPICGFKIGLLKFESMCQKMSVKKNIQRDPVIHDNFSALQNLGSQKWDDQDEDGEILP